MKGSFSFIFTLDYSNWRKESLMKDIGTMNLSDQEFNFDLLINENICRVCATSLFLSLMILNN